MKHLTLALLMALPCTLFPHFTSAQFGFGKPKDVEMARNRTLIVIVAEENEKVIDQFKQKGLEDKIADYKSAIAEYNANMKEVVEQFWKFSSSIEYKTSDEVQNLFNNKSDKYAVIYCGMVKETGPMGQMQSITTYSINLDYNYTDFKKGDVKDEKENAYHHLRLNVKLIENLKNGATLYAVDFVEIFPSKAELAYGVQSTQDYFSSRLDKTSGRESKDDLSANTHKLANKTLLISKRDIDEKLDMDGAKAVYPFPVKIADDQEINNEVMKSDSGYAFIQMAMVGGSYIALVIDCGNRQPLTYTKPSFGSNELAGIGINAGKNVHSINAKTLEALAKQVQGK